MDNYTFASEPLEVIRRNEAKKKIRSTATFIGLAMLITVAVSLFWGTVYINIMASFGIDSQTAISWINEPAVMQLANQILSLLMFTLPFFIVLSGCGHKFHEIVSLSKPDKRFLLPVTLISIAFCSFANIAGSVILALLAGFGIQVPNPMPQEPTGVFGMTVTFLGAAVVAPIVEEFAMRGIVMGSLRKFGDGVAIFVSAVLFGLMHGNLMQIPFAFIVGLALGFAVIKTGSLWSGILIHAINNALATVLNWATKGASVELQSTVNVIYFIVCMLCAFVGVYLLKGKSQEVTELEYPDSPLTQKQSVATFFKNPLIIIYILLIAIQTIERLE